MANINLAALDMFRTANNWTADSIANLDGKDAIKNVGEYKGRISALGRTTVEKTANNAMRTELLKSLANAFNMEGMTISDGKARFTREFLRNLERKLGVEFKRGDFTLDAQGNVNSGRPLTARRIKAILCKVGEVAANEATAGWSEGAGPTGSLSTGRADAMVFQSGKDPAGEVEGISSKAEKSGKSGKVGKSAGMDAFGPVKTKFGIRKEIYNPFFAKIDDLTGKRRGAPEHVQKV